MRKLTVMLGMFVLSIGAATQVNAVPNNIYCVEFLTFCDQLQLDLTQGDVSFAGQWNNCLGEWIAVEGFRRPGREWTVVCSDIATCTNGFLWLFRLDLNSFTVNVFKWDGVNPPFPRVIDAPFGIIPGACAFPDSGGTGLPLILAN